MKTVPFSPGDRVVFSDNRDGTGIHTVVKCNSIKYEDSHFWNAVFSDGKSVPAEWLRLATKLERVLK